MSYQHYLPATFLANFSKHIAEPRRDSLIAVGDRQSGSIYTSTVGRVAGINGFYDVDIGGHKDFVDGLWTSYEGKLAPAIDGLIHRSLSAMDWAMVLVQFVSDMLVRPPNFNYRFQARWPNEFLEGELGEHIASPENINGARMLERQRLFAPFAAARWDVLCATGEGDVIVNDLGYCPMRTLTKGEYGIAVPLDRTHILGLVAKRRRKVAVESGGSWTPSIQYVVLPVEDHSHYNEGSGRNAQRFIYGADEDTVRRFLYPEREARRAPEPGQLGFMDRYGGRLDEMKWYWLIEELAKPPRGKGAWIDLRLSQL